MKGVCLKQAIMAKGGRFDEVQRVQKFPGIKLVFDDQNTQLSLRSFPHLKQLMNVIMLSHIIS